MQKEVENILEFWNIQGQRKHKNHSEKLNSLIAHKVEEYGLTKVRQAIKNFTVIYLYNYKLIPFSPVKEEGYNSNPIFGLHSVLEHIDQLIYGGALFDKYNWIKNSSKEQPEQLVQNIIDPIIAEIHKLKEKPSVNDLRQQLIKMYYDMPYEEYLKTDHWVKFRRAVFDAFDGKCIVCNTIYDLHVHHRHYTTLGEETFDDVALLCGKHHREQHNIPEIEPFIPL
jgi:hypothetical protein